MIHETKIDLIVNGIIRTNGIAIFKDKPPIIDMFSRLSPQKSSDNRSMLWVHPGMYVVQFDNEKPKEFLNLLQYEIRQADLHKGGLHLEISPSEFEGLLLVYYTSQIELGSKIATLVFKESISDD